MGDALGMEVLDTIKNLFEKFCCLLFCQGLFLCQKIKQFSTGHTELKKKKKSNFTILFPMCLKLTAQINQF